MRCKFEVLNVNVEHNAILIQDLNGPVSVTNDAEEVVKHFYNNGMLSKDTMLLYIDSQGQCDELSHDGKGHFTGYSPGGNLKRSIVI